MFVLDTNVVSELRNPRRADPRVVAWIDAKLQSTLFLSAVTVFELALGVELIDRRDAVQGAALREWLNGRVLATYAGRILPMDTTVALWCARLHVPNPRPKRDSVIAATALVHGMTVVSRDVSHFAPMGVRIINPWSSSST